MTEFHPRAAAPPHGRAHGTHGAALSRRRFVAAAGAGAAMALAEAGAAGEEAPMTKRPHILMITCHDIGQHVGCYGVETVRSPNLDGLARRGVRFHNYYGGAPTCSPSRGVMLTGRYPQSNGLMGLTHAPWWWSLNPGERHLAAILTDAGYHTVLAGLQHVTRADPHTLGYDEVLSKRCVAEETVAAARQVLARAKTSAKPVFLKVGFFEVHRRAGSYSHREPDTTRGVFIPPYLKNTPAIRDDLARFQADVHFLDACIGRILEGLEAAGIADRTLVIFTAEHGIAYPGAKWCLREPGLRIPYILHRPGTPMAGGKVYHDLMSHVDFLPTLLGLVGVPVPENVQGMSFAPLVLGKTDKGPRRYVFGHRQPHARRENVARSVRDERFKLIRCFENDRVVRYPTDAVPIDVSRHTARPQRKGARPFAELFDLKDDPNELHNLSGDAKHADVLKRLNEALYAWMHQVNDPLLNGPIATPYYKAAMEDFRKFTPGGRAVS